MSASPPSRLPLPSADPPDAVPAALWGFSGRADGVKTTPRVPAARQCVMSMADWSSHILTATDTMRQRVAMFQLSHSQPRVQLHRRRAEAQGAAPEGAHIHAIVRAPSSHLMSSSSSSWLCCQASRLFTSCPSPCRSSNRSLLSVVEPPPPPPPTPMLADTPNPASARSTPSKSVSPR